MAIPAKQIGWSQKSNLLWQISKQLEILTGVLYRSTSSTTTTTSTTTATPTTTTTTSSSSTTTTSTSTSSTTTTTTTTTPTTTTTTTAIPTVTIGTQVWMSRNLDVTTYQNGDPIPEVTNQATWDSLTTGAWCYYNNDSANGPVYGKLYNWYALTDPRGIGPVGYHAPSDAEWTTLVTYLGGDTVAGGALKEAGLTHWDPPNTGATNSSGFTGLPAGTRFSAPLSVFTNIGSYGHLWSITPWSPNPSLILGPVLGYGNTNVYTETIDKAHGRSIRLIQN